MRIHEPELISQLQYVSEQRGTETFTLGGLTVRYATIDLPDEQKPFPLAVAAAFPEKADAATPMEAGAVLVSSDVPETLRGLWAMHEYVDFGILGHGTVNRCLVSDQRILTAATEELGPELASQYSEARIGFYQDLALYMTREFTAKGTDSSYAPEDITGCLTAMALHQAALEIPSLPPTY
jgi:hypothetical protein